MDVTPEFVSELEQQAGQLRACRALGRSSALSRLFDYLLQRSLAGHAAPKEIEIALNVFGRPADFDGSSDPVVRVYIHKLRRRLDEYYSRAPGPGRIVIPKGEYRLILERSGAEQTNEDLPAMQTASIVSSTAPSWKGRMLPIVAVLGVAVFGAAVLGAVAGVKLTSAATGEGFTSCSSQ